MKIRGRKFQVELEAVGLQHRVESEGEHLVHDASRRRVKKVYADAMTASVRRGDRVEKLTARMATVSVTNVTGNRC